MAVIERMSDTVPASPEAVRATLSAWVDEHWDPATIAAPAPPAAPPAVPAK